MNPTETFQHYQVLRRDDGSLWELGRGAMGVTYKAFDVNLRCPVALKVINGTYLDHPVARQRFIREARAAAALRHRNIAHVYHLGMDAQSFFYAMEFVDGETLDALVRRRGPLPPETVLHIALQTARALSAAARQRLVHRDIKPTNLMVVTEDDDGEIHQTVKVIDFGLARSAVHGEASANLTMGGFVGTPQYASPEQLEERNVDGRSDIYSLGASLWYLLAGRPPFVGTLTSLITQHLTKEPPWDLLASTPAPVRELLQRMLQKNPDDRPQSAADLRREIEVCLRTLAGNGVPLPSGDPLAPQAFASVGADEPPASSVPGTGTVLEPLLPGPATAMVGSLVGSRYQIMRRVGEGSMGRVFQAHDLRGQGRTVALKMLYPDLLLDQEAHEKLRADVSRIQAAPCPGLLQILDFDGPREAAYLVTEWSGGLTLVDLLRSRGRLTVAEALVLLKQAAGITDFARARGLENLELHLHQIFVVPGGRAAEDTRMRNGEEVTEMLGENPLSVTLRIDPLGRARDQGDLATWAGDLTLLPASPAAHRDQLSSIGSFVENTYLHRLARLFYEWLESTPLSVSHPAAGSGGAAFTLPGLGETGSAVLRSALSSNPTFSSDTDFFEALAKAAGYEPDSLRFHHPVTLSLPPTASAYVSGPGASTADAPLSRSRESVGTPVAVRSARVLKPVIQRQSSGHTWMVDLRALGRLTVVAFVCLLAVTAAWIVVWLHSHRTRMAAVAQPPVVARESAPPSPEPAAPKQPIVSAKVLTALPTTQNPSDPEDEQDEDSIHDWMDGTVLAAVDDEPPGVTVPYAPGFQPAEEEDADEDEVQIPYAPGMNKGRDAQSLEARSAENSLSASTNQNTAAGKQTRTVTSNRSAADGVHTRSHRRTVQPQPNFWQRLFRVKPKPRHGKK